MFVHSYSYWLCEAQHSNVSVPRVGGKTGEICFSQLKSLLFEKLVQHDPCKWELNWRYIHNYDHWIWETEMGKCEMSFANSTIYIYNTTQIICVYDMAHVSFIPRTTYTDTDTLANVRCDVLPFIHQIHWFSFFTFASYRHCISFPHS